VSDEAFRHRVRAALAAPVGAPLAERFPAPLVTALIAGAEPGDLGRLTVALEEVSAALHAVGLPRGRLFVLLGSLRPGPARQTAASLRERLALPVMVHDGLGAHFTVGLIRGGVPIQLNDELREAEALVLVGPARGGADGLEGGQGLLCPGVVSAATRAAWEQDREEGGPEAAIAFTFEAVVEFPASLSVCWTANGEVGVA
jgi:hypothetical protein